MAIYIIIIFIILNIYLLPSCFGVLPKSRGHPYYKTFRLVDEDICHPFSVVHKIDLKKYAGSALSISPGTKFNTWFNRTKDFECKFIVKAPKDESLFASIQSISFRKNGDECLDYVKFRRKGIDITSQICGDFHKRVPSFLKNEYVSTENYIYGGKDYNFSLNLGEYDVKGEIETTIFVSQQNVDRNYELDLVIVYTPYKNCDKADADRTASIAPNSVCIRKDYLCDGVENCNAICMDEKNCPPEIISTNNNTVTISAVTTIMFLFIIFIMGLCLCKKNQCCCWSTDCAGPNLHDNRQSNQQSGNSGNNQIAESPMLEVNVLQSTLDKDLPPSYDSLFPEQTS